MESSAVGIRDVLAIPDFRRLWTALSLSSLGDWLGLLAQSSLAASLAGGGYAGRSYAVAGVFVVRLIPAVLFGPIAGVVADRLDRRWTMVAGDSARCLLFISIPLVGTLWWLFAATFLIEIAAMFWIPAKEATVPNLVPPRLLEPANQVSLLTAYGTAPIAAGVFTVLALITRGLASQWSFFTAKPVNLALYFDALTFLFSALTIAKLKTIPARSATERAAERRHTTDTRSPLRTLLDGWHYLGEDRRIRGVIVGTTGAFAAGGAVVGLARTYVGDLHAGQAAYGVLFGTLFLGMAAGMFSGSHILPGMARERLFGSVIFGAGVVLCVFALVPSLLVSVLCAIVVGFLGGTAWIIGQTMLGREVADELRGRTFAFVQSLIRVTLVLILAVAPALAGLFGGQTLHVPGTSVTYSGAAITLFGAGLLAAGVGWVAYRMMDDVPGKSLRNELKAALKRTAAPTRAGGVAETGNTSEAGAAGMGVGAGNSGAGSAATSGAVAGSSVAGNVGSKPAAKSAKSAAESAARSDTTGIFEKPARTYTGTFVSFEGGDGSGKSTQLDLLADWLRAGGHEVVVTREPGGTPLGAKLRHIVLDARNADVISPRAEALIYAADRADHVERVIRPALERGAVVITDRYVDSSLAYQGAGRALSAREVELLSHWATQGLMPDVTILMDLDPIEAARRRKTPADRLELESVEFHRRVRNRYLELAADEPQRFIVINALETVEQIARRIKGRLEGRIHLSRQQRSEEAERREAERRKAAQERAVQMAEFSDAERRRAEAEAEQRDQEQRQLEAREAARQENRRRLEEQAARAERAARERAQGVQGFQGMKSMEREQPASEPPSAAAERRSPGSTYQASTTPAGPSATPRAEDISAPSVRGEWEVPDYVAEPEFDDAPEQDALSMADELFGARPQGRRGGEDA